MKEIKAAVQGKTINSDGTVDHTSTATTPHLTLGIVWYDFELTGRYSWVKKDGLLDVIDVVSPWVWHQNSATTTPTAYTSLLVDLKSYIPPTMVGQPLSTLAPVHHLSLRFHCLFTAQNML